MNLPLDIDADSLLLDLYHAYKDARRHKRGRLYQLKFEADLESRLISLRDELMAQTYTPLPSTCFIIHEPKMREVFAANFRDRIVHHLFYNYTYNIFQSTFIQDSYSCLKGRGTHYGIKRLKHHIMSESRNYSRPCFVMKLDICGYFMHIDRVRLLSLCLATLQRHADKCPHPVFTDYLLETIVTANPVKNCIVLGNRNEWNALPHDKSLFKASKACGLPIGNLSSQLFSNVYLNVFDQYCKRTLRCRHYGRYVDDAFIVSSNREWLFSIYAVLQEFLHNELGLTLHPDKTKIYDVRQGVEFLGAFVKPYRTYPSSSSFRRIKAKLYALPVARKADLQPRVNSFLGVLSHYDCYSLRRVDIEYKSRLSAVGRFSAGCLKFQGG